MNTVVLDGYTLNPGDLNWEALERLGPCTIHDRTPPELTIARASGAAIALTNKTVLKADHFAALPELRYIGVLATGYNVVDVAAARGHGIVVTNVPAYSTMSVAQMVFAHVLSLALHVDPLSQAVAAGRWASCPDFAFWDEPQIELAGLTFGIVGFGQIGRAVARLADGFGMRVLASSRRAIGDRPEYVEEVPLDQLLAESDIVSLHCPLTPQTRHLINAGRLRQMKPTAILINTSRGPLVDEQALADALHSGRLAGAGVDTLSSEPPPGDHPLIGLPNCRITPHVAWATTAARRRLMDVAVANVQAFLAGRPQNVVNQ